MNFEIFKRYKALTIAITFVVLLLAIAAVVYTVFFLGSGSNSREDGNNNTSQISNEKTVSEKDESESTPNNVSDSVKPENTNSDKTEQVYSKPEDKDENITEAVNSRPEKVIKKYDISCKFDEPECIIGKFNDNQNGEVLPYRMYLPKNYDSSKKYPVVIFLHSAGEVGTENNVPAQLAKKMYRYNGDLVSQAFVLCPQSHEWWNIGGTLDSVIHLLDEIKSKYSCDGDRIYVTGISMGGCGTWDLLAEYGDIFAAGIPMCGWGDANTANALKDIPIRVYHSMDDNVVSVSNSQTMYDAIKSVGGNKIEFYKLDGLGHNLTDYVFHNRDAFCWLFAQNKSKNPTGKYEYIPYFRVVDSKGNTVISDGDIDYLYQSSGYEGDEYVTTANIYLTNNGKNKLTKAYTSASSKDFTVYWCGQKLYTYKATKAPVDELFAIVGILDDEKDADFQNTIQHSCAELKKINGF